MKDFSHCPRCGSPTQRAIAFNESESEFWLKCTRCNTYINTYIPQPHQQSVHEDNHSFILNAGGYGTGKTYTTRQEVYKHAFITPNTNIIITANVSYQYEQTIKRDIEADIPADFVKGYNKIQGYMDLINGTRIMYRPLDDEDKLRSLNVSMFVIIEASETTLSAYTQLKTRARNTAASVPKRDEQGNIVMQALPNGMQIPVIEDDWIKGIVESNPDSGWIRTDMLYVSDSITPHGTVCEDYEVQDADRDPKTSTHIASTDVNKLLPPSYIENQTKNKPLWWINRFIFGSFSFAEGLVYPSAAMHIVPTFQIPTHWKRIVAADYGLSDDFVYLCGAIDVENRKLYIYKEIRTNNRDINELANIFHKEIASTIPIGGYYCAPILDPKSGAKRDYNKKSLYDHFLDYGINFMAGQISVDARVLKTNTYFEAGSIKIMECCTGLITELKDYKFPAKKLGMVNKAADKPIDKNNHAINPLEWMVMELPKEPNQISYGAYDGVGNLLNAPKKQQVYDPFSEDEEYDGGFNNDYYN